MSTPYTYLIGWKQQNLWYYGSRYAKDCNPSDLWVLYFTSSKYVQQARKNYGEPDIIEVRKTFETAEAAREWEHKFLRKIRAIEKQNWLNKTDNKAIILDETMKEKKRNKMLGKKRKPHSEETKEKISKSRIGREPWNKGKKCPQIKSMLGKKHSEESNEKNRRAHLGKKQSQESNKRRSEKLKGRVFTEEHREKLRQAALLRYSKHKKSSLTVKY